MATFTYTSQYSSQRSVAMVLALVSAIVLSPLYVTRKNDTRYYETKWSSGFVLPMVLAGLIIAIKTTSSCSSMSAQGGGRASIIPSPDPSWVLRIGSSSWGLAGILVMLLLVLSWQESSKTRSKPRRCLPRSSLSVEVSCKTEKVKPVKEMAEGDEDLPRDAKIVKSLLKSMGVEDYEPRVIHQFLELWYRYVVDVLTDAQVYSEHAGKPAIDCDDVKLAIQSKVNSSFSQPPPREVLLELARNRNKAPLPKSIAGPGIPLPPEQDTLIKPNYQLAIPNKQSSQAVEEMDEDEEGGVDPTPSQEQKTDMPQHTPQRVAFSLAKRPK
nr:transcription initiation factor tfiid subunit 9 [Quercus suber]